LVFLEPAIEEEEPGFLGLAGEDEGLRAGAVFGGVFGGRGAAFGRGGAGAARVAFFGLGLVVVHLLSELSVKEGVRGFEKIWGKLLKVREKLFFEKL
jgi:hypothetical protein